MFNRKRGHAGFFRLTETQARVSHPAVARMMFAERVSYNELLETFTGVTDRPKENPSYPKPSLDAV